MNGFTVGCLQTFRQIYKGKVGILLLIVPHLSTMHIEIYLIKLVVTYPRSITSVGSKNRKSQMQIIKIIFDCYLYKYYFR
jgi:hypothetical protein